MDIAKLLISPFIFIIEQLYLFSYKLSGNHGIAIILLSFWVSLILLPIFVLIEKAKKKDDDLKLKMKPLVDEIKRCYKGQERFYYLKTLNRQHNYSPLRALIPILSLLLQIPFFIAAYQFLEVYEPLAGESFLFIKDLSAPDGLLGSINILPIAMTVVNLLTAYFYTRNSNANERKQILIVAGVFLVLLFKLPAGLVLYWTMNNVFGFFRLFVTNPEVFKQIEKQDKLGVFSSIKLRKSVQPIFLKLRLTFIVILLIAILIQLNWAIGNNFEGFTLRIVGAIAGSFGVVIVIGIVQLVLQLYGPRLLKIVVQPKIFYSLFFLTFYFYFAAKFYFTGFNNSLASLSILILATIQSICVVYIIRNATIISRYLSKLLILLLLFVFVAQVFNLIVFIGGQRILLEVKGISLLVDNSTILDIISSGLVFLVLGLPFYMVQHKPRLSVPVRKNWLIYLLAVFYITGLIFLWQPLIVYSSSPETFDFPAINIIHNNILLFIKFFLFGIFIYFLVPRTLKATFISIVLLVFSIVFVYSFVVPLDLGSLQESRFSEQERLAVKTIYFIIEGLFIIGLYLVIKWVLSKKASKIIISILISLNIFLIGQGLYLAIQTGSFQKTGRELSESNNKLDTKPLSFSKEKQNIVFFVADGFQGWFVKKIMEEDPDLRNTFKGFVWYPNTVSISNYTHSSLPAMLGGNDYSVENVNNDNKKSIKEKWNVASKEFILKAKSYGYNFSSEYLHYMNSNSELIDNTFANWNDSWKIYQDSINLGIYQEVWYKRLYENAIFSSVPVFFKPKIYNNKKWLSYYSKSKIKDYSFKWYNFIRLLPYISNNISEKPNFIFIHNAAAHNPWNIVDNKGKARADVTPYQNNKWYLEQLGNWIKWMQENEVYNNTKIILISDHGPSWYQYDGEVNIESPLIEDKNDPEKIQNKMFWRLNPLLLVKDFESYGDFQEDWRIMSNADASAIAFDENDPTKEDTKNRVLESYWTVWASKMIENNTMEIKSKYEVSGNIFDLKNWEVK